MAEANYAFIGVLDLVLLLATVLVAFTGQRFLGRRATDQQSDDEEIVQLYKAARSGEYEFLAYALSNQLAFVNLPSARNLRRRLILSLMLHRLRVKRFNSSDFARYFAFYREEVRGGR